MHLRRAMRRMRAGFDADALAAAARAIAARAAQLPALQRANTVATYLAFRRELPTDAFREVLPGVRWAIPRVEGDRMEMVEHRGPLVEGPLGIPTCEGPAVAVDALLVPGLAFDRAGYRVGWGGGYYDRYLSAHGGFAVGLALDEAIVEHVPHESHDWALDAVVTPTRVLLPDNS